MFVKSTANCLLLAKKELFSSNMHSAILIMYKLNKIRLSEVDKIC